VDLILNEQIFQDLKKSSEANPAKWFGSEHSL
jgi:hypothetical protein